MDFQQPNLNNISLSTFTCMNCGVRLESGAIQREHFKSDWHRYNLKRRVAELPPLSAEEFQSRLQDSTILTNGTSINDQNAKSFYCNPCRKQFSNQSAYDNHLQGRKHKDNEIQFKENEANEGKELLIVSSVAAKKSSKEVTEEVEELEDEEIAENPLTACDCLFCNHRSKDMLSNFKHMSVAHSFFLPDADYCVDPEGLLDYLGEKVAVYFICLWCNDRGKTFYSMDAVRKHMRDKGHCKMLHEGAALVEYTNYYDYSSSYPDHENDVDIDEELPATAHLLEGDEYQLVLPSGAVIGHRSLLRYYKQRLNPQRAVVPVNKADRKMHQLLNTYRSLGWTKTAQRAAACKARDIHVLKRAEAKWMMKLGCKANKLQKHYRQQVVF